MTNPITCVNRAQLFCAGFAFALVTACGASNSQTAPDQSAELTYEYALDVVHRLKVAKSNKDIPALLALYHEDVVVEQPSMGVRVEGLDALGSALKRFSVTFPDYDRVLEGTAMTGDTIVSWGQTSMTLSGPLAPSDANGEAASLKVFVTFKFQDGKIIHEGHYWDLASLARQSGVRAEDVFQNSIGATDVE